MKKNEIDMIHGPLAGKILMFALPLAASSVLQQLFNAADLAVVGKFASPQAMAAVGSNASVISLLVSLFTGLSVGANVVVANILGSGRRDRISEAVHTIISIAFISGVFLLALGMVIARPILTLMGAPDNVISLATLYLRIYFCGMPAIMLYNFSSAILRSKGDSRRPFIALTAAGVLNVLMNLLFVVVFHLHVIGVGLATVLSNYFSGILTLVFLIKEQDEFRLNLKKLVIKADVVKKVVSIGVPAGIQGMVFSISNVVIQSAVNSFGSDCIAGMSTAQYFDSTSFCLLNAFALTCTTFTSQNYGAWNRERCKKVWRLSMLMGLGVDMILVACFFFFRYPLVSLFTNKPEVVEFAMVRLTRTTVLHFLCGTYEITAGALRGIGKSSIPAIISIIGTCVVRLLYVTFVFPRFNTPEMLMIVYPISWVITGTSMNIAYLIAGKRAFTKSA